MTIHIRKINSFKHPEGAIIINTTSGSKDWTRGLSPFVVGPVKLYNSYESKNVENGWQFSKVYKQFIYNGEPTEEYFKWAIGGWGDSWAHRYPMGRGAIPEYSYWDGRKLGYIEARKEIYIPLYSKAVKDTEAFGILKKLAKEGKDIYLLDYDAYDHREIGMTYEDVINCKEKKMGHAFVLAMMIEGYLE
jgi:hypothetical protein